MKNDKLIYNLQNHLLELDLKFINLTSKIENMSQKLDQLNNKYKDFKTISDQFYNSEYVNSKKEYYKTSDYEKKEISN